MGSSGPHRPQTQEAVRAEPLRHPAAHQHPRDSDEHSREREYQHRDHPRHEAGQRGHARDPLGYGHHHDRRYHVRPQPHPTPQLPPSANLPRAEIQEGMAQAREISEAITQVPLGDGAELEDLDEELERMEQEALDNKMLGAPAAPVTATPNTVRPGMCRNFHPTWRFLHVLTGVQWRLQSRRKKTRRRQSCGDCRPRWPCRFSVSMLCKYLGPLLPNLPRAPDATGRGFLLSPLAFLLQVCRPRGCKRVYYALLSLLETGPLSYELS